MTQLDTNRPLYDQDGRKAELASVSQLALEFPITAFINAPDGRKTPMAFDRFGISRSGPAIHLTNAPSRS